MFLFAFDSTLSNFASYVPLLVSVLIYFDVIPLHIKKKKAALFIIFGIFLCWARLVIFQVRGQYWSFFLDLIWSILDHF